MTVDVRERQRESSTRSGRRHRIPYSHLQRTDRLSDKQWFEVSLLFLVCVDADYSCANIIVYDKTMGGL